MVVRSFTYAHHRLHACDARVFRPNRALLVQGRHPLTSERIRILEIELNEGCTCLEIIGDTGRSYDGSHGYWFFGNLAVTPLVVPREWDHVTNIGDARHVAQ